MSQLIMVVVAHRRVPMECNDAEFDGALDSFLETDHLRLVPHLFSFPKGI